MKILVAEDDLTLRQLVELLLLKRGIPSTSVEDGQSAVDAWESGEFGLIFMDVQMPGMNGLEATRAIREREKLKGGHVAIVALTAHARPEDREICRDAGMDDYVSKPIDFEKFYSLVERYC